MTIDHRFIDGFQAGTLAAPACRGGDDDRRDGEQEKVLRVTGTSKYQPPHRSPHSIALLKDVVVGDFDLTVHVQNTNVNAVQIANDQVTTFTFSISMPSTGEPAEKRSN